MELWCEACVDCRIHWSVSHWCCYWKCGVQLQPQEGQGTCPCHTLWKLGCGKLSCCTCHDVILCYVSASLYFFVHQIGLTIYLCSIITCLMLIFLKFLVSFVAENCPHITCITAYGSRCMVNSNFFELLQIISRVSTQPWNSFKFLEFCFSFFHGH